MKLIFLFLLILPGFFSLRAQEESCQKIPLAAPKIGFFQSLYQALSSPPDRRMEAIKQQTPSNLDDLPEYSRQRLSNSANPRLGEDIYRRLHFLGPQYPFLAGDPAVVDKLDSFEKFAQEKEKENAGYAQLMQKVFWAGFDLAVPEGPYGQTPFLGRPLDPFKVRKEFSDKLGTTTVYRGLALTSEELAAVKEKGMDSSFLRLPQASSNHFRNPQEPKPYIPIPQADERDTRAWSHLLERRVQGWNPGRDPYLSVTKKPEVAIDVAGRYAKNGIGKKDPEKEVYLFKLKIPTLVLIEGKSLEAHPHHPLAIPGVVYPPDVESFTLYHIPPTEIEEITRH